MAGNKDFIEIIREIRGSAAPGDTATDGIWYELTVADIDGNPGIYGDILAKYGVISEGSPTLEQAVAILENLNVEVTTLGLDEEATSELIDGVWKLGIPKGENGANGLDGHDGLTPEIVISYNETTGNLESNVTYVTSDNPVVIEEW